MSGSGSGREDATRLTHLNPRALAAEQNRLAERIKTISRHRTALEAALAGSFAEGFTQSEWRLVFESADPDHVNTALLVTGGYSAIVNSLAEILRTSAGSKLLGLLPHKRPRTEQVIDAVRDDGGLTVKQAQILHRLYVLEGRVEHASPDVDAIEIFDAVVELRRELPELIRSAVSWLGRNGVTFAPET